MSEEVRLRGVASAVAGQPGTLEMQGEAQPAPRAHQENSLVLDSGKWLTVHLGWSPHPS